ASRRFPQPPACICERGEPPGLDDVPHGGHHQRVIIWAHHILYGGEQFIQGRRETWQSLYHDRVRCYCRRLAASHHVDHAVSSCLACAGAAPPQLSPGMAVWSMSCAVSGGEYRPSASKTGPYVPVRYLAEQDEKT